MEKGWEESDSVIVSCSYSYHCYCYGLYSDYPSFPAFSSCFLFLVPVVVVVVVAVAVAVAVVVVPFVSGYPISNRIPVYLV